MKTKEFIGSTLADAQHKANEWLKKKRATNVRQLWVLAPPSDNPRPPEVGRWVVRFSYEED